MPTIHYRRPGSISTACGKLRDSGVTATMDLEKVNCSECFRKVCPLKHGLALALESYKRDMDARIQQLTEEIKKLL